MSNYPPGMSHQDFVRAGIIEPHHHECEFVPCEHGEFPIIEDGAAIFHERCNYVEGQYGDGWECERERSYRFEYSSLESPTGTTWDLPTIGEWDDHDLPEKRAKKVIAIEERFHAGRAEVAVIDPDRDEGVVTLNYCDWKLHFEP